MKCAICGHGSTHPGTTTVTLEKDGTTLVIKNVPAEICDNCGERYVSEKVTGQILRQAQDAVKAGIELEVRSFAA
jgi:YgiT-type zinc finger domain-containing protein